MSTSTPASNNGCVNSFFQRSVESKLTDTILITGFVALIVIAVLATLGKIQFTGSITFSYCMYGAATLFLIAEIVKCAASSSKGSISNQSQEVDIPKVLDPAEVKLQQELGTDLEPENYMCGLVLYSGAKRATPDQFSTDQYNLATDLLFFGRPEAVLFNEKGIVSAKEQDSIAFAYTPLLELINETFDPNIIKNIVKKYSEENQRKFIPRLFISTAVAPLIGIPHALLLVIEADPSDPSQARITLIDSFGASLGYQLFKNKILKIAQEVFPSKQTTVASNPLCQQFNGWSCGWSMLANVECLSKQDGTVNLQAFVEGKKLPVPNMEAYEDTFYQTYIRPAVRKWNQLTSEMERKTILDRLFDKGQLIGDRAKGCKAWYEAVIKRGPIVTRKGP